MLSRGARAALRSSSRLRSAASGARKFSTDLADDDFGAGGFSLQLSEEQAALQGLARQFAVNDVIPVAAQYDQTMEFPREVFNQAWELGLVNTHIPEAYGGLGLGCLEGCIIGEELA
jgi:acyl-CoA dehydrogenase